jgi:small subunit ribosomal protein S5
MTQETQTKLDAAAPAAEAEEQGGRRGRRGRGSGGGERGERGGRGKRSEGRDGDDSGEIQKPVYIGRVSKTVKGGKRFSIAALVVVGDGKGRVGYGKGKAKEVQDAMRKAQDQARRNMVRIPLREGRTIHHDVFGKYGAGKVHLRTAPAGTGIIAGGPMRAIFEALGVSDVVGKSLGSSNPHNMVRATILALQLTNSPRNIAARRNKKVTDIIDRPSADIA